METDQGRIYYLDNIRVVLVYFVVFFHIICMFTYPMAFFWPATDKEGSSLVYENIFFLLDIFMMPLLLFVSSVFIFYSLKNKSTKEYLKKRFTRLVIPILVFVFCAGDIHFQLLFKRLDMTYPSYFSTFLGYFRDFLDFQAVTFISDGKTLNEPMFTMMHTWFLSVLFAMTVCTVILSHFFRNKEKAKGAVDSRKKIIVKTILLSVILGVIYCAIGIAFNVKGIRFEAFIRLFAFIQVRIDQLFLLLPLFLFGLYMDKKEWLTRGDIGSWKMWGILSAVLMLVYGLLGNNGFIPTLNEVSLAVEHNMTFSDPVPFPVFTESFKLTAVILFLLRMPICIFLLMFLLSFTQKYFNKPNPITAFCSKHSINVYLLHYIPVLLLQYCFVTMPGLPIVKVVLMFAIIIPACLWLSYRLVSPYPGLTIALFVVLKLVALFAGFEFYFMALLTLTIISFAGALVESMRLLMSEKTIIQSA